MRLPGRWVLLALCVAVACVGIGLAVSGAPLPWSPAGQALPTPRARVYENVDACLLSGASGLSDPVAAQEWAGMEDASKATSARVSYLAVGNEVRLLKILQDNYDERIIQDLAVSLAQGLRELWDRLIEHLHITDALQCNKTIRLNRYGLVELRAELKRNVETISCT